MLELSVHKVKASKRGYKEVVVPVNKAEMHHYRNGVSQGRKKKYRKDGRKVKPMLGHKENKVLVDRFVKNLIERVGEVCDKLTGVSCIYIDLN